MLLDVSTYQRRGCIVVRLRGELDLSSARDLDDRMVTILARPATGLVLDLSRLCFADLAGIRTLLAWQRRAGVLGRTLVLASPQPAIARMLDLTELGGLVAVYTAVEAAFWVAAPVENTAAADITDLIMADRVRIQALSDAVRAARAGDTAGLARAWAELSQAIDGHLAAVAEIWMPALCGTVPDAQDRLEKVRADQEDIRELLRETQLQATGSALWWRLAEDAFAAWAKLAGGEVADLLADCSRYCPGERRHRLGRQWVAFLAAWPW